MNLFGNMRHRFNYCESEFTIQFWKRFKDSLVSLFVNFYTHKIKELFIAHNWNFIQYLCMLFKTIKKKNKLLEIVKLNLFERYISNMLLFKINSIILD